MRLKSILFSGILVLSLTSCATESDKLEKAASKAEIARDYEKAKELYFKSYEEAKSHNKSTNSLVRRLTGLPNVPFEKKEELLKEELKQGEKNGGPFTLVLQSRLLDMAAFYEAENPPRYAEAEVYRKRILENTVKQNGDNDPTNRGFTYKNGDGKLQSPSEAYGQLAFVLERQGKYEEAEPLRRKEIEIKSKRNPAPNLTFEKKQLQDNLVKQGKAEPEPAKMEY